jgi:hypothetical protein
VYAVAIALLPPLPIWLSAHSYFQITDLKKQIMKIWYYVSGRNNPLYGEMFYSHGRYKSYGQHSFIYDFLISACRNNVEVNLIVDELHTFPISRVVEPYCRPFHLGQGNYDTATPDLILLDVVDKHLIQHLPRICPIICIIHNAGEIYDEDMIDICDLFICMTDTAYRFQSKRIHPGKLRLINQGIDLLRFPEVPPAPPRNIHASRILYYTRLNSEKKEVIFNVLEQLRKLAYNFTVLGDGQLFWEISDSFGHDGVVINHIPCHSIPRFISQFDLVISSGRGVMEACAVGRPAICAGLGYAGVITAGNVMALLERNLTGYGHTKQAALLHNDIATAMAVDRNEWRKLAKQHFNMDAFVTSICAEARKINENTTQIPTL